MRIKVFFIFVLICATLAPLATWAQVDRIELGYQTTRRGIVWYRPGLPTRAPEWKFSRDTNAVLWVDTLTALRYDWDYLDNVWRTKGTAKGATPPLPVQTSGTATIDNRSAYWLRDTFNLIHKYDSTASAWTPWGDWFYLASVPTDIDLTGAHGAARYRRSLWQNNSTFEVRYWDGDSWEPFAGTADGSETIVTAGTGIGVTGTGTSGNPYIVTNTGDLSATNEIQSLTAGGAGPTSYTLDLSLSGGSVTLSEGSGIDLSRSGNTITIASTAGPTYYQTLLDDGAAMTQQPNENFVSTTDISFTLTNDGINTETEVSADIPANAVDYAEIQQAAANKLIGNPTGSTANVTEIGLATGLSFSGGNLTPADNSATNEIQALTAGDGTGDNKTLELSLGGGTVTLDPAGILTISRSTNTLTLTATEVDGDASNELQTLASSSDATSHTVTLSNSGGSLKLVEGANVTLTTTGTTLDGIVTIAATSGSGTDLSFSGTSSPVTLNSSTGTDVTMTAGGIVSMSATSGNITISATEIDGSITNEIQAISAGDGTGDNKTIDLSLSGGTITLDPAGIFTISRTGNTLTMTGTEVDGSTTNEALTISDGTNSEALGGQTLTVSGAGINVASYSIATNTLTITGTEVDGNVANEGVLGVGAGGASSSVITSNTSGATGVTINAAGIITISESTSSNGGSITLTGTEVDGSTTNELQTLSNTSNATSHTVTLSSSGGSVQMVEGSGITLTTTGTSGAGIVTIAASDPSATNEAWTIDGDDADTEVISNQTVKFQGAGITTTDYNPATDVLLITSTEVDGSISNELQTYAHSGTTSYTNTLSNGGGSFTLQSSGIVTISNSSGTVTIGATEVDGSVTNELQTIANTSDATSHTVTLSNSGGSVQMVEGTGITLTTTGTSGAGIVTIANTGDLSTTNEAWTIDGDDADTEVISNQTVKFQGAGITTTDYNPATDVLLITSTEVDGSTTNEVLTISDGTNSEAMGGQTLTVAGAGINVTVYNPATNTLTITGTEVDGSVTNEGTLGVGAGGATSSVITSNTSGATGVTINAAGILAISESTSSNGGSITLTATEVDGSTSNELQTFGHSGTTSYTNTLSNGGGSFTLQSSGIVTISNSSGTVTIGATEVDGSVSNELQTYSHAGTTSYTNTLSSGGGSFTLQSGGIVTLSHSAGTTTISAVEVDGSTTNEIQTLSANGAGPTSYTLDLSLSGGSVTLSEGSGIDLTRSGNTITIASTAGTTYYQTLLDDGSAMTQQPNENFVSTTDVAFTLTNDGINTETEVSADIPANAVDYAEIQQAAANKLIGNPTGSTANVTEIGLATGLSFSGGNLTPADNSATNELQTLANTSNSTTHTVTLSNSGGSVQLAEGSGITLTTTGTTLDGVVTVAATDASASNEIQTLTAGDGTGDNKTIDLSLSGGTVTLDPAGILTISRSTNTLTLTATEADGDASNELQTLASSSDATSHTVTLSSSGGSLKLVEGANVTLTTTGTTLDGIVTIAATSGSGTDLSFSGASSPVTLNSSTGTDVTMTAGGIVSMSATSGNITISATEIDGSVTNEIQAISAGDGAGDNKTIDLSLSGGTITLDPAGIFTISRSGNTFTMTGTEVDGSTTNEALTISDGTNSEALGGQTLTISGAGINVASYSIATNTLTITGTEVDGSVTNEGTLGVGAGGASSSVITSNTSGATGVTINAAGIITISESTSSNGGSITITGTEVDGSTTNELQTLSNTSNATSHTVTLSSSGGSVQLVEGSNITLTTTGTTADGIVTIAATAPAGDGNGIYGDGTAGSGDDVLPPGGSTVTLPGQWQPLQFNAATAAGQVWTALQVNAATCSDDRFTKYLVGKSPSDSLEIYNFDCGAWIKETGGQMTLQTDKEMMLVADSFSMTTVPARTILPYVLGITSGGWVDKIAGTSTGQILQWNNTGGYWEIGTAPGGGTVSGTGSAGQATYWTGTTTIAGENNHWWDAANDRLGIGTNGATPSSSVDITKNSLGTTQTTTSGLALVNTTAAAVGTQQISPALRFSGNGWKTTATAASQPIEFRVYANPVQGTAAPTGYLGFGSGVNGSFTDNQINFSTTGEIGINVTDFTSAGAVAKINVNGGTAFAPFVFNTWGTASSSGGVVYGQIANTLTTSSTFFSLNEQANYNTVRAGLRRFGSTHTTRPGELNLVNIVGSPVTIGTNDITRMTVDAGGTVYTSAKLAAGFSSTTGIHSTVQSAGSIATAYLETVGAPTFDDTKRTVIYTASTNISWTLPTATACNCPGREYILHHAGTAGTVTLSQSINKGNAGNFNTLTAGQWAYIIYGTSGGSIRGYKITSL